MKKWIERILLPISLIGGYGFMALVYFVIILAVGYLLAELLSRTLIEPSALIVAADVLVVGLLIFLLTRKKVRLAFSEFWKQVLRNM